MSKAIRLTRAQAIRKNCSECMGNQPRLVKKCEIYDCPLWRYRGYKEEIVIPEKKYIIPNEKVEEEYYNLNKG